MKAKLTVEEKRARELKTMRFRVVGRPRLPVHGLKRWGRRTQEVLGYTRDEFVDWIDAKLEPRMIWTNCGKTFHVDHIVPVAEFVRRGITDPKIVCALVNLRPITPTANLAKKAEYTGDFEADLAYILAFIEERA
ncbi:hypothetical protein [Paraburkholderia youngii]|uniref:hypothetical protein n=1 Tax=Paraburkholderia youngii TaxID=2782701 RepID=UPI003D2451EC